MRILLVADGRSPITRRYIKVLNQLGHIIFLISSFPCSPINGIIGIETIPLAFGSFGGTQSNKTIKSKSQNNSLKRSISSFRQYYLKVRYLIGPYTTFLHSRKFKQIINREKPDIVHALRIPFEGMLTSLAPNNVPVLVSIWGNDLTLHAKGSLGMRMMTKRTLLRADGLISDARRDIDLASKWGYLISKPRLVIPGSGGIDMVDIDSAVKEKMSYKLPTFADKTVLIVNPRGFRPGSVRNDTFFKSIPRVIQHNPNVHYLCPAMLGQVEAQKWIDKLGIGENVHLLPTLDQHDLWKLFSIADATISVSQHDGVPNSLLEAMAIGCFPIVGDIASIREWITDGENGIIIDPADENELSEAILIVINSPRIRQVAANINRELIETRVEVSIVMQKINNFYENFL